MRRGLIEDGLILVDAALPRIAKCEMTCLEHDRGALLVKEAMRRRLWFIASNLM